MPDIYVNISGRNKRNALSAKCLAILREYSLGHPSSKVESDNGTMVESNAAYSLHPTFFLRNLHSSSDVVELTSSFGTREETPASVDRNGAFEQ